MFSDRYYFWNCLSVILLVLRTLKLLDFQARLFVSSATPAA